MKKHEGFQRDLSQKVALQIGAEPFTCWDNAHRALLQCQELEQARYVEGWATTQDEPGLIMTHGWLELPSEDLIDPTPVLYTGDRQPVYFAGLSFTKEETRALGTLLEAFSYGWQGLEHPAFRAAHKAAWEHAHGESFPAYMEKSINANILLFRREQRWQK